MERERRREHFAEERGVWAEGGTDLTRVNQFSDGVFAIAATLIALEIRVPDSISAAGARGGILVALLDLAPRILAYTLTFLNIAVLWIAHHRQFSRIRRYDTTLLWMNAFFLMFVAFLPVASSALGRYPDRFGAVAFYAVMLLFTSLAALQTWLYATRDRRLVDESLDPRVVRYITLRSLLPAVVFAAALPVAVFSTLAAEVMIALIFFVAIVLGRVYSPALAHLSHPHEARGRPAGRRRRTTSSRSGSR